MTISLEFKSNGIFRNILVDNPKRALIQLLKKKVGPKRYRRTNKNRDKMGKRSKKKLKKRNSAIKNIEPGKPKKIKQFIKLIKNSLGHKKLTPLISVISLVLKRRFIASTNKKELVESSA